MEIEIIPPEHDLPVERAYVVSMIIKSFKGRKDVEVHLFRTEYDESELEQYDWKELVGDQYTPDSPIDPDSSLRVMLEAFTAEERDKLIEYLNERYDTRVSKITSCPLGFPIPMGLPPLSAIPEGKTIGFVRFEKIPNYTLPFQVHGFYDLSQHEPLLHEQEV